MRILFLSDNFPPEVNAPASRTFEHCREWVRLGHSVTVVTCAPNFPHGKIYKGYKNRLWHNEERDGIRVIRVWTFVTSNEGFKKRVLDYMSFMLSAILTSALLGRHDIVIGTSPQFFTVCAAYVVGRLKRIPFVFELRDLWPESVKAVGVLSDSPFIRFFEKIEMFLYRKSAGIVSVTESFKKSLISRGIDEKKISVVTNGVDDKLYKPIPKSADLVKRFGLEGKFVCGYIGTHGLAHSLETILEAAKMISERIDGDQYRFILLGDGARKTALMEKAKEMKLENVVFIDSVSKEEVPQYWSLLDASIIHLKNIKLFKSVIPSKIFECMGMGIPLLHGVAGESGDIVKKEQVGLVFESENPADLVNRIIRLREDRALYHFLKVNCLAGARKYNRTQLANDMLGFMTQIAEKNS